MRIGRPANLGLLSSEPDEIENLLEVVVGPQVELPDETAFAVA
jgi:hypothetical protein